jgi:hypothetical protein
MMTGNDMATPPDDNEDPAGERSFRSLPAQ